MAPSIPATTVKMPQLQQQSSIRSPEDRIGGGIAFNYNDEGIKYKSIYIKRNINRPKLFRMKK